MKAKNLKYYFKKFQNREIQRTSSPALKPVMENWRSDGHISSQIKWSFPTCIQPTIRSHKQLEHFFIDRS